MLTPRENFIRFLKGETYEWTPTSGDQRRFAPALIPDHVARGLVVQQKPFPNEKYGGKDLFGVDWLYQPEAKGSIEKNPLFLEADVLYDWREKIIFPNLDDLDWEGCARENSDYLKTDKLLISTIYTGFFERLISFVGFENAAVSLVDDDMQEAIAALFDALADLYIRYGSMLHKYFDIEYIEFHDDWGTQTSTMFSRAVFRKLFVPPIKKMTEGLHSEGVFVKQHSCGMIESLVPDMIDTGVDTWLGQSVNDKEKLISQYGERFKFGVYVSAPQPFEDKAILEAAKDINERLAGKRVWLSLPWGLPPDRKERLGSLLREGSIGK